MIKYLINAISNAFSFSRTESKGTLVLIFLCIAVFTLSNIISFRLKSDVSLTQSDSLAIAQWQAELESSITTYEKSDGSINDFNSARTEIEEPPKRAPVTTSEAPKPKAEREIVKAEETPITFKDLNTATAEELQKVRGIGPVLSERIVKFRDKLGGFHSNAQLGEVYGLKPEVIEMLEAQFQIQSPIKPLDLNVDSLKYLY